MAQTGFWLRDQFPVVYEGGQPKAVLVDIASFAQMELIIDNLSNREEEPEDAILAASEVVRGLVARAKEERASYNWQQELDDI